MPDAIWHWSGYTLAAVAGLFVLWALFADRARGRRRCRRCWYDMTGLGEVPVTCPECGRRHAKAKHLVRTRRRWRLAFRISAIAIVAYGLLVTPRVRDFGFYGIVPTWVLILAGPWMDDDVSSAVFVWLPIDPFAEHWYADQLEERSNGFSRPTAAISYMWFRWCEKRGIGSSTPIDSPTPPLTPQLCQRLIQQSQIPRWLLSEDVIEYCESIAREVEIVGSRHGYSEHSQWGSYPRLNIHFLVVHAIPQTWRLRWQEFRGGKQQPHWFGVNGGSWSTSSYTVWEGGVARYRVTLTDDTNTTIASWEVEYEVQEGEHLDRTVGGLFPLEGDVLQAVPVRVQRLPSEP